MLQGKNIQLHPVKRSDLVLLQEQANDLDFQGEYGFFGFQNTEWYEQNFAQNGFLSSQSGMLLVTTLAGQIAGFVSYHAQGYGPNEGSRGYNIGIALAPEHQGHGYGTEAQHLLAAYLFATYPIMRVEAATDIENIREQRALEKAHFKREGVLRQAQWRNGRWHDMILYSRLRSDAGD
jgi:RimJ/RimL family protein N-acetyltransferase